MSKETLNQIRLVQACGELPGGPRRGRAGLVLAWAWLIAVGAIGGYAQEVDPARSEITPPDVFAHVGLVRAELELIRIEMGCAKITQPEINVRDVRPREVYFQGLTLARKASRLRFEHTDRFFDVAETARSELTPADVHAVVQVALEQLRQVKTNLSIPEGSIEPAIDESRQPTDVFRSIVQANRQLNVLLEKQFSARESFQQVSVSIGLAARLLAAFPEAERIPPRPPLERGKRPADVYRRLLGCFGQIRSIAARSGVSILEITVEESEVEGATPSDVYDIASLVVSELAYLRSRMPDTGELYPVAIPGRKVPSDVYQQLGILEAQLCELDLQLEAHPDRISHMHGADGEP